MDSERGKFEKLGITLKDKTLSKNQVSIVRKRVMHIIS